ncbi:hypothetical protein KPH14_004817 [Odynerus spinipes]|uniref:Transmembrane protein 231 n=1 Tax=Odynerus spinipes TaxID=1348599 RepID=A0AAD9RN19_9HYME|nr:hypothetical protein KPH14_004817 [Odynerus spinipes]
MFNVGGFWIKTKVHAETPDVSFQYKYLLLAERGIEAAPIVCSTFISYKENRISDDCLIIKVQETDTNNDGKKDILKFEARFYTDIPIKNLKLFLFFDFKLKQLLEGSIQSLAIFNHIPHQDEQHVYFIADLELKQRGILHSDHLYEIYNHSIELTDWSLLQMISQNVNKKFSAQITNTQVITQAGFSKEEIVIVQGELHYTEYLIYYQPGLWEELKWAWIQHSFNLNGSISKLCLLTRSSITDHVNPFKHSSVSRQGILLCSMRIHSFVNARRVQRVSISTYVRPHVHAFRYLTLSLFEIHFMRE